MQTQQLHAIIITCPQMPLVDLREYMKTLLQFFYFKRASFFTSGKFWDDVVQWGIPVAGKAIPGGPIKGYKRALPRIKKYEILLRLATRVSFQLASKGVWLVTLGANTTSFPSRAFKIRWRFDASILSLADHQPGFPPGPHWIPSKPPNPSCPLYQISL